MLMELQLTLHPGRGSKKYQIVVSNSQAIPMTWGFLVVGAYVWTLPDPRLGRTWVLQPCHWWWLRADDVLWGQAQPSRCIMKLFWERWGVGVQGLVEMFLDDGMRRRLGLRA